MFTVDIDTGGTMTDALVSDGTHRHAFKVDTTPHDYTVSFLGCLSEAAKKLGFNDVENFLPQVRLIRWSSTITTNVLGERRGSKVGLLVSKGHERNLYGSDDSPVVGELVDEENIIGLPDNPDPNDVLAGVKRLLEGGVRRICVCLKDSFPDNQAEVAIKRIIEDQYPDHIIGSVPVLLGSEMAQLRHDQTRVHYSVMNAYTHSQLAMSLFKAEDVLRDRFGSNAALLIGHTNGGVARIGKTKAVDTIESGPVFGTYGGAYMAQIYGTENVACFDVGGTTTKASIIRSGEPVFQRGGDLMEVPVQTSFAMVRSAVVGGGSIARVLNGLVTLGPESMGAAPGPACYGLGGTEATLTDALLVLRYLDAGNFLGGRRRLNAELARAAIERNVAKPLNLSVEMAAITIRDEATAMMADLVRSTLAEAGLKPEDTALFAFGGNGPMFGAFLAEELGMKSVHAFDLGPVFGAFGSSISDVVHVYERGTGWKWDAANEAKSRAVVADLQSKAERDLQGEGFDPKHASFVWELEMGGDRAEGRKLRVNACERDPGAVCAAIGKTIAAESVGSQPVTLLRLSSRFQVGAQTLNKRSYAAVAGAGEVRDIRFDASKEAPTPVHRWEGMNVGDKVLGPAVINGATLTCPVPPGWMLTVDEYGNANLKPAR